MAQQNHRAVAKLAACVSALAAIVSCTSSGNSTQGTAASTSARASASAPAGSATEPAAQTTLAATTTTVPLPHYLSGDSNYLFDQEQLHTFEITVPEDQLAKLDESPAAEEYVEGNLSFEGESIGPIGVRYKGSVGAFVLCTDSPNPLVPTGKKTCTKLSMKLKFDWNNSETLFFGQKKVQLHSQNLDPTKMHERLGYYMFRAMGVPAPRSTHARVVVNGEFLGVFALTEQIDEQLLAANLSDGTGNLYKEVWPFDGNGDISPADKFTAGLETNKKDANNSPALIRDFATALASAPPGDEVRVLDEWVDLDLLLTTFVVDRAIKNDDGAYHWYCFSESCAPHNFYWYENPSKKEVGFIPWDLDNAFDNLGTGVSGGLTAGAIKIADDFAVVSHDCQRFTFGSFGLSQQSAGCDRIFAALGTMNQQYDEIRARLLAGPMSTANVEKLLQTWTEQIKPSVAQAARLHPDAESVDQWLAAVDQLRQNVEAARLSTGR